jgi:hypothetical protein
MSAMLEWRTVLIMLELQTLLAILAFNIGRRLKMADSHLRGASNVNNLRLLGSLVSNCLIVTTIFTRPRMADSGSHFRCSNHVTEWLPFAIGHRC